MPVKTSTQIVGITKFQSALRTRSGLLLILVLLSASWIWTPALPLLATERAAAPPKAVDPPLIRDIKLTTSYAPVVALVAPSVVYVYSTKTVKRPFGRELRPLFDDPLFRRFFGDRFDDDDFQRKIPRTERQKSLGSGVIVGRDGHILTNNHVIEGADEIKVSLLEDKRTFTAKVVGKDAKTDIAVLKIEARDLPPITFANNQTTAVGDVVLAVGNPFGIGQTVTMGIVSATRRGGMGIEEYEDFIQTDAAINPGNSGGALVDTEGKLVGICTAILSRSGGNLGVGFAVPIELARSVMDQILKKGHVERGYLGVSIQDITSELRKHFNVPEGRGALIGGVTEESAAAEAGLKPGDVIVEFDGKPVKDSRTLKLMVGQSAPGARVEVRVLRGEKEKTFTVKLKETPEKPGSPSIPPSRPSEGESLRGVSVTDIDEESQRRFNLPAQLKGAIIAEVDPDSVAYESGLRPGDVVEELNRQPIENAAALLKATEKLEDKQLVLRVWSRGGSRFVVVDESKDR